MEVHSYKLGSLNTNCYIVSNDTFCLVIDPGENPQEVINALENKKVDYILLTHAHHDHISGLNAIRSLTQAPVLLHQEEGDWLSDPELNMSASSENPIICDWADILVTGEEVIEIGETSIQIIHTPGHSPGSISFLIEDYVFTGDSLLNGFIGPTDLPFGNRALLIESIKNKLFTLDPHIKVCPGHGDATTIGFEKDYNVFPRMKSFFQSGT